VKYIDTYSSGETRNNNRRRLGISTNSRSDWLKSGLVWSGTLSTLLSTNGEGIYVLVFAKGPTFRTFTVEEEEEEDFA